MLYICQSSIMKYEFVELKYKNSQSVEPDSDLHML